MNQHESDMVREALKLLYRLDTNINKQPSPEETGTNKAIIIGAQIKLNALLVHYGIPEETVLVCPYCGDIKSDDEGMCCGESSGHFETLTMTEYEAGL